MTAGLDLFHTKHTLKARIRQTDRRLFPRKQEDDPFGDSDCINTSRGESWMEIKLQIHFLPPFKRFLSTISIYFYALFCVYRGFTHR